MTSNLSASQIGGRWLCVGLLALTAITGCQHAPKPAPQIIPVVTATISPLRQDDQSSVRYSGTIKPHRQVDLAFRVSGYVNALLSVRDKTGETRPVQAGDAVTAGAVLARLSSTDYRAQATAANAQAATARANAAQAVSKLAQARASRQQAISAVAEAHTALQAAQAQRAQAISGVAQAESGIAGAETEVTLAQSTFERTDDLYHSGSATRPQEDVAQANKDAAAAKLAAAQQERNAAQGRVAEATAQIHACQAKIMEAASGVTASQAAIQEAQAAVRAAQSQIKQAQAGAAAQQVPVEETIIRAPITGIVLARRVEVGSLVGPGTPAFSVAGTARMDAVFGIPEIAAGRLRVGQRLTLTLGAGDSMSVTGTVTEVSPTADPQTRVFDVQITLPNTEGRARIGDIATLALGGGSSGQDALAAPISAIVQSRDQPSGYAVVVIANENGQRTARYRDVELGPSGGDHIIVRGLSRGTQIVASSPSLLYDGEPVRIADTSAGGG